MSQNTRLRLRLRFRSRRCCCCGCCRYHQRSAFPHVHSACVEPSRARQDWPTEVSCSHIQFSGGYLIVPSRPSAPSPRDVFRSAYSRVLRKKKNCTLELLGGVVRRGGHRQKRTHEPLSRSRRSVTLWGDKHFDTNSMALLLFSKGPDFLHEPLMRLP